VMKSVATSLATTLKDALDESESSGSSNSQAKVFVDQEEEHLNLDELLPCIERSRVLMVFSNAKFDSFNLKK
jgi:nucleoside permease NupC